MCKQITKRIKKIWLILLILFLTLPSFLIGRAFAYWSGLVSPPAAKADDLSATSGTGTQLPVNFYFTDAYVTTDKLLVPIGCKPYAFTEPNAEELVYKDYTMYWDTTDTTATQTNINLNVTAAGLYDVYNSNVYTNYLSNVQVQFPIGTYGTPGDHTTFVQESGKVYNYTGTSLGDINYMLPKNQQKIVRISVSILDGPRGNQAYYDFKAAVVNSVLGVHFSSTVTDPNQYKTTNIWATFNVAGENNKPQGPKEFETTTYLYHPALKIYTQGANYVDGDILVVTTPGVHYGEFWSVLKDGPVNIDNPVTQPPHQLNTAQCVHEYVSYHLYDVGDFVMHNGQVYYWSTNNNHHNFNPGSIQSSPPNTTYWTASSATNPWYRFALYTYGDVVLWWSGDLANDILGTLSVKYISISNVNVISDIRQGGNKISPNPSNYATQWMTAQDFRNSSLPWSATTSYNEGQSVRVVDGSNTYYYIAIVKTQPGQSPTTHPTSWREVDAS